MFADENLRQDLVRWQHAHPIASLADDVLFITFNGLSKNYRSCGYRGAGWWCPATSADYIEGLNMLSSMRLCANTPGSWPFKPRWRLSKHQRPGARRRRLCKQRDLVYELLNAIPGVSVVKQGALYMFPRLTPRCIIANDQQFAYELLAEEKVLIVQGTGFNWSHPDHFRLVFLPNSDDLTDAIGRIARFLKAIVSVTAAQLPELTSDPAIVLN